MIINSVSKIREWTREIHFIIRVAADQWESIKKKIMVRSLERFYPRRFRV